MSLYDSYFLMSPDDVIGYVREKLTFFDEGASLECREIGDGNINYVFQVFDDHGKSLIVKQAGEATRISEALRLSTDRGRIEASVLQIEEELCPGMVPRLYLYDPIMCVMAIEYMEGYSMMRTAVIRHEKFPKFADQISTFMVDTLLPTTDVVMNHKDKKKRAASFINPDLCEVSEDLVYTEPYTDLNGRNNVFPPNLDFIRREVYEDLDLRLEAAKLKFEFMNNAQALIHGDLHTGSIFINQDKIIVFDPEFAFYGPIGYDVGNIIANMVFVWINADATMSGADQSAYKKWVEETIRDIADLFIKKFRAAFQAKVTDPLAQTPGFLDWYLDSILADTAGVCGLELMRRTVGMANVKDITTIEAPDKRLRAERIVVMLAKNCIKARTAFKSGGDYLEALFRAVETADSYN
ncbi:S-methyl-5-thioribose kinase [Deltaproteobacteria bacterium Smac51]|nr:S-methyl-5-thioribose kinase [Deltaproteobacteria bacterium Smac51]